MTRPRPSEPFLADAFALYRANMLPPDASDDVVATCQHAWAYGMALGVGCAMRLLAHRRPTADDRADLANLKAACMAFMGPPPAEEA